MKRRGRLLIFMTVIMVLCAIFMSACSDNNKDKETTGGNEIVDKDGWTQIATIDNKEMFTKFLLGFTNFAYELSKDRVKDKNVVTVNGTAHFSLNDNDFYLTVKGKYDYSDGKETKIREKAMAFVELATSEVSSDETRLLSIALYRNNLYLALADNKVKFSVADAAWTSVYPYEMKQLTPNDLTNLAAGLNMYVKLNGDPVGYTRRNSSKEEFKYSVDINMKSTVVEIIKNITSLTGGNTKLILQISDFISSLLGISISELSAGNAPESTLKIDFITSGNKIQSLSADMDIDMKDSESKLIEGDTMNVKLFMEDLEITNRYTGVNIDFVNDSKELAKYIGYSEAIYRLNVPIKVYDENGAAISNSYEFRLATHVFQENPHDNFVFVEYYNTKNKVIDRAFYVYQDIAYIYVNNDNGKKDAECVHNCKLNLSDLATRVMKNDLGGKSKLNLYTFIAYLLRNMTFTQTEFRFSVNPLFFVEAWYNFDDMVAYIDSVDETDLYEDPEVMEFVTFLKTNEIIFTFGFMDDDLLNMIDANDAYMTDTIAKLTKVEKPKDGDENNQDEDSEQHDTSEGEEVGRNSCYH